MPNRFEYVKKGYDPEAVDRYIDMMELELRSYKEKSNAINQAIVSAQQASEGIIQNAKNQGRVIRANTAKQLEDVLISLATPRQWVTEFKEEYNNLVEKYLKTPNNKELNEITSKIDTLEAFLRSFSEEVNEDLEIEKQVEAGQ